VPTKNPLLKFQRLVVVQILPLTNIGMEKMAENVFFPNLIFFRDFAEIDFLTSSFHLFAWIIPFKKTGEFFFIYQNFSNLA
jgi:hypothetical protein